MSALGPSCGDGPAKAARTGEAPIGSESRCQSRCAAAQTRGTPARIGTGSPANPTHPHSDRVGSPVRKRGH